MKYVRTVDIFSERECENMKKLLGDRRKVFFTLTNAGACEISNERESKTACACSFDIEEA
jgi:hypothetical protein